LALGHGEAIHVWPQATGEECVAVDHQVMRGDGGGEVGAGAGDEIYGFPGRYMLEHDLESRQTLRERLQYTLDEDRLAIGHVDSGIGDLAVDEQRHADIRHTLEHRRDLPDIGHPLRRMSRGVCRIELRRGEDPGAVAALDLAGIAVVAE